jgi:protein-S-isoprenylcysteine O-methyltransferase Ste14
MNEVMTRPPRPRILPPRGLLVSLLAQIPLVLDAWPLHPVLVEVVAGACLIGAGLGLNVWADRAFKAGSVGICPFSPAPILLRDGPYRFTRNPMYLGLVAITLGVAVLTGVLANAWSAVALFLWLHWGYVVPEEQWLRDRFTREFDAYAADVPRWLVR